MVHLRTLGTLELRAGDGREIRSILAQPKRLALLAYLAVARPTGFHRRDTVVGLLWPESRQSSARHSLNQSLYMLRRSLGPNVIASRGNEEVGLTEGAVRCDAVVFRTDLQAGRTAEALEAYRGDLLDGFFLPDAPEFERWLEGERRSLRESATGAACELAERLAREDGAGAAGHWARRAADLASADEGALRRALHVLVRIGDQVGARERYEAFRRALPEGLVLSPETRELEAQLFAGSVEPARGGREAVPVSASTAGDPVPERLPEPPAPRAGEPDGWEPDPASPAEASERARPCLRGAPPRSAPFVGRDEELRRVAELLERPDCWLVTVAGPPGAGKTRLALEAASGLVARFRHGGAFVPLASVEPATLASAVAGALEAPAGATGHAADALLNHLREREILLVLDDFDGLVGRTDFIETLLATAPGVKLLVTSREALNLRAEWLLRVEGLGCPASDTPSDDDQAYPAVHLFLECARRTGAPLEGTPTERSAVGRICRLAEGLPLAIELAAAWARALPCQDIAREMEKSRRFLATRLKDVPARHASLWTAFEHSWGLLTAAEREAFRRLSVFRRGFTREAAARVAGSPLPSLATLVDRSLLHREHQSRYGMLESLQEFAAEKLAEDPDVEKETRDRHAVHYLVLLRDHGPALGGSEQERALARLGAEMDNVRAAWWRAVEAGRHAEIRDALQPLSLFYELRGWQSEAAPTFGEAACRLRQLGAEVGDEAERREIDAVVGRLHGRQGAACLRLGLYESAEEALRRGIDACRLASETEEVAFCLDRLGVACYYLGRFREAAELEREALALRRTLGDLRGVATSLNNLGSLAYALGDHSEAERLCEEALKVQREMGDDAGAAVSLQNLGHVALVAGDQTRALRRFRRSLEAARGAGAAVPLARALHSLGNLANAKGDTDEARRRFRDALAITRESGLTSMSLEILAGLATSFLLAGSTEMAVELLAFVRRHPAADATTRETVARLLEQASARLPEEELEAAVQRGEAGELTEWTGRA